MYTVCHLIVTTNCVFCWSADHPKMEIIFFNPHLDVNLKPQFLIKSSYYIVPSPSTALVRFQYHLVNIVCDCLLPKTKHEPKLHINPNMHIYVWVSDEFHSGIFFTRWMRWKEIYKSCRGKYFSSILSTTVN